MSKMLDDGDHKRRSLLSFAGEILVVALSVLVVYGCLLVAWASMV